jgi:DNA-binding IclR family transcriptional regulator
MAQESSVRTVERALDILDCFATGQSSYSLTEIAEATGLSPSTTLRLLGALEKKHYLYRDQENLRYCLGYRLAQLSNIGFANLDFCQIARPYLQELLNQFRETVGLYALNGKRRVCVARLEGSRRLRSVVRIGESFSLTRGASGRVLLAYQPPEVVEECLREDPFEARQSREDIRRRGYAISRSERESGLISIAAPVFDAHGQVVASLFLTGADVHFDQKLIDLIAKTLVRFAWEISVKMGHNAPAPEL